MYKYKYTKQLLLAFAIIVSFHTNAQQILRGVVTDKTDKSPLIGATVIFKNANNRILEGGSTTDLDGKYTIKVPENNLILQVSFIGYEPVEIPIGAQTVINVELQMKTTLLDEAVVYGSKIVSDGFANIEQKNLASSVTMLDLKDVAGSSATSVSEMLQGRAAGVYITQNSGDPGANSTIQIRGNTSLSSNSTPLIVIDGVPIDRSINISNVNDLNSSHSPLSDVNPSDIENIIILKDAAATAIYGSKGANGVILITTKRGRANKTDITINSQYSIQHAPENIPLLSGDDLKTLILEGEQNRGGGVENPDEQSFMELRDDPTRNDYYNYNNNTNWYEAIQQRGHTYDNNFALRGGGNTTRYSFSLGSTNQTGTTRGTSYNRLTSNFNLDYNISDKLTFKSSTGYTRSKTVTSEIRDPYDWDSWIQNPNSTAGQYPSFFPIYKRDIYGNELEDYYIQNPDRENTLYNKYMYNPYAWTDLVKYNKNNNSFRTNQQLILDIVEGLNLISRISIDYSSDNNDFVIPYEATNRDLNDEWINRKFVSDYMNQTLVQENLLSYKKSIAEIHEFTVMAINKYTWWKEYSQTQDGTNSGNPELSVTNRIYKLASWSGTEKGNSLIGNFHYKLLDRYIIQGTVNYEGSSKFGPSNRFATFPTLAGAWIVSNESFLKQLKFIEELKLRYSWGKAGNSPRDKYLYFSTYSAGVKYLDQVGVTPDKIQLNTLQWETTTTNNLGLDMSLFKNRFKLTVEIYDKYTSDLLMKRKLPSSSGYGEFWSNFGDVQNKGLEIVTEVRPVDAKIKWDIDFNISFNENKIVFIPDDWNNTIEEDNGFYFITKMGDAIGSVYGYICEGVYPTDLDAVVRDARGNIVYELDGEPKIMKDRNGNDFVGGDAHYKDINFDGIINDQDIVKIGDATCDYQGGFSTRLTYKSWVLNCLFQYVVGNDIVNVTKKNLESMPGGTNSNINQATSVLRRWRKQGDITDIPRVNFSSDNHNNYGSTRFIEDGSFLRLKSLSLTYNLPSDFLQKIKIKSANIFFNAYNILTFTNYTGADPEISLSSTNPGKIGLDKGQTAVPKSYTTGLRITF